MQYVPTTYANHYTRLHLHILSLRCRKIHKCTNDIAQNSTKSDVISQTRLLMFTTHRLLLTIVVTMNEIYNRHSLHNIPTFLSLNAADTSLARMVTFILKSDKLSNSQNIVHD